MKTEKIKELIDAGAGGRVIADILETLKAYEEIFVTRENGKFDVSASICLSARAKASDFKVWRIFAKEIYDEKERMLNFVESFAEYPDDYTGKRDYAKLAFFSQIANRGSLRAEWVGENIVLG